MPLPVPLHDPEVVRETAREILSRPRYSALRRGWLEQAVDRARAWLGDVLGRLFTADAAGWVAWVLVGLAVAVLVALAARFLVGVRRDPQRAPLGRAEVGRSASDWESEAAEAEAAGDLRGAVQATYRALIAALAARGWLDEVAGRTVGEYRRDVAHRAPASRRGFDAASDVFETVWYGGQSPTGEHLVALRSAAASARKAVAA